MSVDAVRVIDTRGSGPVTGGEVLSVPLSAPSGAVGAVLNVTAVGPDGSSAVGRGVSNDSALGFATVFPCEQPLPNASNLNYRTDEAVPNAVITGIGANGQVCVCVGDHGSARGCDGVVHRRVHAGRSDTAA